MTPESMNAVFEALAHPVRRKILDVVKDRPGCSVNDVSGHFEISRIAVMKHLNVLVRADLVVSQKQGRTRQLYFNAVPIQLIHDRWTSEYSALWAAGLTRVKYRIEAKTHAEAERRRKALETKPASNTTRRRRHA
jgi:predicted transcriptional regulator